MRRLGFAHHHRRNWSFAHARVEASCHETLLEVFCVIPQILNALRLLLQNIEGRQTSRGYAWRMRSREQEWPRPVIQKLDQATAAADITAEYADSFRECPHLDVHAAVQVEMIDRAAPVASEHTRSMRVVHHHDGAVLFRDLYQCRERADIAFHGENAVGDEQLAARNRTQPFEDLSRGGYVFVRENVNLGFG